MNKKQTNIIGLKELRENMDYYISAVSKGAKFTVVRRSEPVFSISPAGGDEVRWDTVVDFTLDEKGGVNIDDILSRL